MLFKERFIELISTGQKTQTRRKGKKRWNVGAIHQCQTSRFGEPFAHVKILDVRRERLIEISPADARAEGFENSEGFWDAWAEMYGSWLTNEEVWVVEFEVEK